MTLAVTIVDAKARPLECLTISHSEALLSVPTHLFDAYGRELEEGRHKFVSEESMGRGRQGKILGLVDIVEENNSVIFKTMQYSFGDYFSLKHMADGWVSTGKPVDHELLGAQSALSMITIVETSDKHLVFGHRTGDHLSNRYLPPSGFYSYTDPPGAEFMRKVVFDQINKSVGIESFTPVKYLGTSHDNRDSFLFVNVFYQQLPHTASEVYSHWSKLPREDRKHDHILFVSSDLKPLMDFLFHSGEHTFNNYCEPKIKFVGKKLVTGPVEHKDKIYEHIENGIGALLLYMAEKYGPASAGSICRDLTSEGIVAEIDASAIAEKGLNNHFLRRMGLKH